MLPDSDGALDDGLFRRLLGGLAGGMCPRE